MKSRLAIATAFLLALSALQLSAWGGPAEDPDRDYDRLDGRGDSGKKVDVVEWEGNLEIHVYPGGSIKGLALKLDKTNKDKPVMVIGYRFDSQPEKQLIRRAILGIDLREGFRAYKDPSAETYDKIVITNNGLAAPMKLYALEKPPGQLYPEGHPALAKKEGEESRTPASEKNSQETTMEIDDNGTIQPFFMKKPDVLKEHRNQRNLMRP